MPQPREGAMKTHLGHYEIVAELGRGGMGVVYKGYEPSLARYVAIKELSPSLAHDAAVVERFLREARSMAMLNDPHIIQIYSIGQENEQPFFVMEFVDGISVAGLIVRDHRLQSGDALKIVEQTAHGLATAHDRGVIHRDVKPANLILSQRGQVKIADFGIALANSDMNAKLTSAGEVVGTPGYLSPEILLGNPVDQRSDLYALGVVLFEMLTGRTPFSDASVYKLMLSVVESEVPDVREINSEIDPGVAAILGRMLLKDPAKRYQSMRELIADLEKHPLIARGGPIKLQLSPASPAVNTLVGLATPMTPGLGARSPAPPPEMGRRGPVLTPPGAAPSPVPAAADTQVRTKLDIGAAATQPSPQTAAGKSGWLMFTAAALLLVVLAGALWAFRGPLFGPAATQTSAAAPATDWSAWHLPGTEVLLANYRDLRKPALTQLRPVLRELGIRWSPELVFNLLLGLVLIVLFRSVGSWIHRTRAKRAYARRSRRPA